MRVSSDLADTAVSGHACTPVFVDAFCLQSEMALAAVQLGSQPGWQGGKTVRTEIFHTLRHVAVRVQKKQAAGLDRLSGHVVGHKDSPTLGILAEGDGKAMLEPCAVILAIS